LRISFLAGEVMMSPMPKGRGDRNERATSSRPPSRRKRRVVSVSANPFILAFADALRDILRHETRLSA
jgi:hypothetical protein